MFHLRCISVQPINKFFPYGIDETGLSCNTGTMHKNKHYATAPLIGMNVSPSQCLCKTNVTSMRNTTHHCTFWYTAIAFTFANTKAVINKQQFASFQSCQRALNRPLSETDVYYNPKLETLPIYLGSKEWKYSVIDTTRRSNTGVFRFQYHLMRRQY